MKRKSVSILLILMLAMTMFVPAASNPAEAAAAGSFQIRDVYKRQDIWSFDKSEPRLIAYEETESYQVTEMFLHNRESLLTKLLGR